MGYLSWLEWSFVKAFHQFIARPFLCGGGGGPTRGLDLVVLIEPSHAGLTVPAVLVRMGQVHLQSGIAQDDSL